MAERGVGPGGFDAIVLAGGLARRLEGADKPALEIGGVSLLDRVVAACADAGEVVCVGPRRPTRRPVRWTREDPPGSGPVAALAAALDSTDRAPAAHVVVLAADLPFLTADVVHSLWTAAAGRDGAVLADRAGKDQWLAACYRRSSLTAALDRLAGERGGGAGASLKRLLAGFDLARVPDVAGGAFDCDTWEDVAHVRRLVDGGGGDHRPPRAESEH
ncbi:NTP transferase domain-containing protein [Actinospica sp. MGRD01-02]|uniref:NTP transferase domain-containing protein n=1 Tax=Actinospica acidithermotolerans TaxID=2828514 RepID=A0A941EDR8_9ACTN|nr:NTP transferase domain-containing protein [Actinospica acidithermotolerans]MBR7828622.1 NTP transferase domain-containing protein [Actinospica acidithermotolerans]